jgi:hypothetical protein
VAKPTPEELEKIKAICLEAGYEFGGIVDGKVVVKTPEVRPRCEPPDFKAVFGFEFEGVVARPSERHSGRKRYGKRPKFHGQN